MDVFETEQAVVVRVELAGVRGRDLKVTVDGDALRIGGVRVAPDGSWFVTGAPPPSTPPVKCSCS